MTRQNNAVTLAPIVILTQNTLIWKKKWDDVNNVWRWRNVNKSCRIPNTWSKILIFLNNELLSSKSWKIMTKSSLTQVSYYCFEKRCYIFLKMLTFFKKNADVMDIWGVTGTIKYIFWNYTCLNLRIKFQVSGVISTSFRKQVGG